MATQAVEVPINTWPDFLKHCDGLDIGSPLNPAYWFRGQADATWLLQPALARAPLKAGLNAQQTIQLEKAARQRFRKLAHLHLPSTVLPQEKDIVTWWMLMQHYGVPTRCLDWTDSPFVALYFAVQEEWDLPGAVWIVHPNTVMTSFLKTLTKKYMDKLTKDSSKAFLDPNSKSLLYFLGPKTHTDRMAAQQTQTSICLQVLADQAKVIAEAIQDSKHHGALTKLIIPATLKPEFLHRLRTMNVTASALFPGIDGLGKSVAELIQLGCWHKTSGKHDAGKKE